MRLIDADAMNEELFYKQLGGKDTLITAESAFNMIKVQPTVYDIDNVISEVKKLDLDGVSMVEDGKYKLVRKNEVISLIQTNGVCNGRYTTCADCYKINCPLSTEKTFADKWSDEAKRGAK